MDGGPSSNVSLRIRPEKKLQRPVLRQNYPTPQAAHRPTSIPGPNLRWSDLGTQTMPVLAAGSPWAHRTCCSRPLRRPSHQTRRPDLHGVGQRLHELQPAEPGIAPCSASYSAEPEPCLVMLWFLARTVPEKRISHAWSTKWSLFAKSF